MWLVIGQLTNTIHVFVKTLAQKYGIVWQYLCNFVTGMIVGPSSAPDLAAVQFSIPGLDMLSEEITSSINSVAGT